MLSIFLYSILCTSTCARTLPVLGHHRSNDLTVKRAEWISTPYTTRNGGIERYALIPQSSLHSDHPSRLEKRTTVDISGKGSDESVARDEEQAESRGQGKEEGDESREKGKRELRWVQQASYAGPTFFDDWEFFTAPGESSRLRQPKTSICLVGRS